MSIDATRVEKVEVDVSFPAVSGDTVMATTREVDARKLMHALAGALDYVAIPKEQHVKMFNEGKL